jgi:1-acyl-sn-glycerol-3-phosphate acyltransferase
VLYGILKPLVAVVARAWLRLTVIGAERVPRDGPVLLAANHLSVLDPALIGAAVSRELDYMAKTELFRVPGFGGLIRRLNAHPVDRTGSDSAALRLALKLLGDGRALLVFPEGTRGTGDELGPAQPGTGMLAALSQAPVVPVCMQGSGRALPRGAVLPRPVRVTVTFGAPLRFTPGRGRARYQEISDEIMAAIGRLKTEAGPRRPAVQHTHPDSTTPGRALASRIH